MKVSPAVLVASAAFALSVACAQQPQQLHNEVLKAVEADPASDASFAAINKLMMKIMQEGDDRPDRAMMKPLAELTLQHHASRADAANIAIYYLYTAEPSEGTSYVRRFYDATSNPDTRRQLAAPLVNTYSRLNNSREASPAERADIRINLPEFVARLHKDMANDEFLLRHADLAVNALNYSLGDRLPDLQFATIDGGKDGLDKYRGKVVLVDIWATWCPPCVAGQPALVTLKEEMKGRPFEIVALSMDRKPEDAVKHRLKQPMPWVSGYIGMGAPVLKEWGVNGYPTYFVLDANGIIRAREGEFDARTKEYVRKLVAELETVKNGRE